MSTYSARLALLALATGLTIAGCADNKPATRHPSTGTANTAPATARGQLPATGRPRTTAAPTAPSQAVQADKTGIPSCDDYLASYVACHRAAAIYSPDQIESRYEQMRRSLLDDAQDPDMRPQLSTRCAALSNQLRQVLAGKPCSSASTAPAGP
ncbi:MAG TPA: hypothetical protein VIM98_07200 [Dyella sp.]|uniref:hypothetical protein n=1 Tax=Dyella sp. TaxID=1869338 RepID=UPI002F942C4A